MSGRPQRTASDDLRGRSEECRVLDDLLSAIRRGESRSLVLRGEAGIGKSALLQHMLVATADFTVLRAVGVESEMEMRYATLHQLCAPLLDRLTNLPTPQREALQVLFGVNGGGAPDRFLVGLAVLSLFTTAAKERPVLCVVDDAHWVDASSAQTLGFVSRRLTGEPVGTVFAARRLTEPLRGLDELNVVGVGNGEARALLASVVTFKMDERVLDQIIAETHGNPLALLDLPRGLTATYLAGGVGLTGAQVLSGRIDAALLWRLETLSKDGRHLLLIAAADPVGDPNLLWRAAERMLIPSTTGRDADVQEFLEIGNRVTFRHPLIRSAVYRSAAEADRRGAHLALADVTDIGTDPDRRAWHLAAAAAGPDEQVALALECAIGRAQSRGGLGAAAAFRQRAVALSKDPQIRVQRALAAAQVNLQAGAFEPARELISAAEAGPINEFQCAQIDLLRARLAFAAGDWNEAPPLLLSAAKRLALFDLDMAREAHLIGIGAAGLAENVAARHVLLDICETVRTLPPPAAPRPLDMLLDAFAALVAEGPASAAPLLRRAADAAVDLPVEDVSRWGWMACGASAAVWSHEGWHQVAARNAQVLRDAGELAALPIHLAYLGMAVVWTGNFPAAQALIDEGDSVAAATGSYFPPYIALRLRALQGNELEASATITGAIERFGGEGSTASRTHWAQAVLYNGLGRYEEAASAAQHATSSALNHWIYPWVLPELVEAAVRVGDVEVAREALRRLADSTRPCGTDLALGFEARSRAMLSEGDIAEGLYLEAIARLGRTSLRPELARAQLLFGEWLRRTNRRVEARQPLLVAHDMFDSIGMEAFAERARTELHATGQKVRKRSYGTRNDLTSQELQIAQLARDGLTNPEISIRLFISTRTVEWHLSNVYTKLDIRSRRELGHALASRTE